MLAAPPEPWILARLPTPIGVALLVIDECGAVRAFDWEDHEPRMRRLLMRRYGAVPLRTEAAPEGLRDSVNAYFDGDLGALSRAPWRAAGTPFQQAVWSALCAIPPGQTLSYRALAAEIGAPRAVRAVGLANGANPVGLIVPCHRVIGADGSLTGYGGGLARKRWLLAHEAALFKPGSGAA